MRCDTSSTKLKVINKQASAQFKDISLLLLMQHWGGGGGVDFTGVAAVENWPLIFMSNFGK